MHIMIINFITIYRIVPAHLINTVVRFSIINNRFVFYLIIKYVYLSNYHLLYYILSNYLIINNLKMNTIILQYLYV